MANYIVVHGIRIAKDFVPETFGRLTTIGPVFLLSSTSGSQRHCQTVECSCGEYRAVDRYSLLRGQTKSCGCYKRDRTAEANTTHKNASRGKATLTYRSWEAMVSRCENSKQTAFRHYGGRGIKVHPDLRTFEGFLSVMGERPGKEYSIDRIDVNGDYTPANCRWATVVEQRNNQRSNRRVEFQGETKTLSQWSEATGLSPTAIRLRLNRGWSVDKALTTPAQVKGPPNDPM